MLQEPAYLTSAGRMPERRQIRVSRSLEGEGERPATERGQPLTGPLPTPSVV